MIRIKIDRPEELFAVAAALEREAGERYEALAAAMRVGGNPEVAAVFDELAEAERAHEHQIEAWAGRALGKEVPRERIAWQTEAVFALDEPDLQDPPTLTPYRALSIAVHNEERAFAFFSYVAANTGNATVREVAEELAREELGHAAHLRQHRRAAYHRERESGPQNRWNLPRQPPGERDRLAETAAALEAGLAREHRRLAEELREPDPQAGRLLIDLAQAEEETAERLASAPAPLTPTRPAGDLRACLRDLETVYDFYARAVEAAREEDALALAQDLTEATITRLARLRDRLSAPAA